MVTPTVGTSLRMSPAELATLISVHPPRRQSWPARSIIASVPSSRFDGDHIFIDHSDRLADVEPADGLAQFPAELDVLQLCIGWNTARKISGRRELLGRVAR